MNLEWELTNIEPGYKISIATLSFNTTYEISRFDPIKFVPVLLSDATQLFHNRIMIKLAETIYKVTLTKLQFNDTGIFGLVVQVKKNDFIIPKIRNANITISTITGE